MCGRYLITTPPEALRRLFALIGPLPNFGPRWNVAPTQAVPVIGEGGEGPRLFPARWGLVPSWVKADEKGQPKMQTPLINARVETAAEKPAFRAAFRRRPAVLPADGFYEWQAREKGLKQPYCIRLASGEPMAFAGIWEEWESPDGSPLMSTAILTGDAIGAVAEIHHRCPVILPRAHVAAWLDGNMEPKERAAFLAALPPPDLDWYAVSRSVNSIKNDNSELVEPVTEATDTPSDSGQISLF